MVLETAARGGGLAGSHAAQHRLICSTCNSLTPVNHRRRKGKGQLYSTEEGSRVRLSLTCRLQPSSGSTQTSVPVLGHETSCPGTCMYPPPLSSFVPENSAASKRGENIPKTGHLWTTATSSDVVASRLLRQQEAQLPVNMPSSIATVAMVLGLSAGNSPSV